MEAAKELIIAGSWIIGIIVAIRKDDWWRWWLLSVLGAVAVVWLVVLAIGVVA
jgi:hypothetical protein